MPLTTTSHTITLNASPADSCYRLIHDGTRILNYFQASGITRTPHTLFCGSDAECQAEMTRLHFTPVTAPYQALPTTARSITKFAFWSRLTPTEQGAAANSTDATIKTFLTALSLAQDVDLDLPSLGAALDYATSINLLAAGRKAQILA